MHCGGGENGVEGAGIGSHTHCWVLTEIICHDCCGPTTASANRKKPGLLVPERNEEPVAKYILNTFQIRDQTSNERWRSTGQTRGQTTGHTAGQTTGHTRGQTTGHPTGHTRGQTTGHPTGQTHR